MDYGHHHPDGGHTYMAIPRTPPQASHKMHRGSPIQLLEELCHKNHWGTPIYSLHTAAGPGETALYYYKVSKEHHTTGPGSYWSSAKSQYAMYIIVWSVNVGLSPMHKVHAITIVHYVLQAQYQLTNMYYPHCIGSVLREVCMMYICTIQNSQCM